jgi:hypothetical protein
VIAELHRPPRTTGGREAPDLVKPLIASVRVTRPRRPVLARGPLAATVVVRASA